MAIGKHQALKSHNGQTVQSAATQAKKRTRLLLRKLYQNMVTVQTVTIFVPAFLMVLNLRYLCAIYLLGAIQNVRTVQFHRHGANFTPPGLQVCLSHKLQINQLNNTQLTNIYSNSYYPIEEELQRLKWWPVTSTILLHAKWIMQPELDGLTGFTESELYQHQTCFKTKPQSVPYQVQIPGALQGVILTMNLQQYDEVSVISSPEYTTMDITPFENTTIPRSYNKIHITPGRFSSVRLRTLISDTNLRDENERQCIMAGRSIRSVDESRKLIDLCVKHTYVSLVTEAKLKYEVNLSNFVISTAQITNMSKALKMAVRLRSKYDLSYRYPIVRRLKEIIRITKMLLRIIDMDFYYICKEFSSKQYPRNDFYHLPNPSNELAYINALGIRYTAQMRTFRSNLNAYTKKMVPLGFQFYSNGLLEALGNWDQYPNEVDPLQNKKLLALREKASHLFETFEGFEIVRQIDKIVGQLTHQLNIFTTHNYVTVSDANHADQFHTDIRASYNCYFGTTGAFVAPFTNRGTKQRFVLLNNGTIVNVTGLPLLYPNTIRIVASHVPGVKSVDVPSQIIGYCMTVGTRVDERFGFDRETDYMNRNAKIKTNHHVAIFVMNRLTSDYYDNHIDDEEGLMQFLDSDSDILACGDLIGVYKIISSQSFSMQQLYTHVNKLPMESFIMSKMITVGRRSHKLLETCSVTQDIEYRLIFNSFKSHYHHNILQPFKLYHTILHTLWLTHNDLEKAQRMKRIDLLNTRHSLQYQLKKLLRYFLQVKHGESEQNISFFLKKFGTILLGSIQIQAAEIFVRFESFLNTLNLKVDASDQLTRVLDHLTKSDLDRRRLFDGIANLMFGGLNFTRTARKMRKCLYTTHEATQRHYNHSWRIMDSWLRQIRFFIARAKYYVESQEVSQTFLKKNIAIVHIFHEDFNIESERSEYYLTQKQFLSTIGSILGMYLGASLPHCLQFVIMLTCMIWYRILKRLIT